MKSRLCLENARFRDKAHDRFKGQFSGDLGRHQLGFEGERDVPDLVAEFECCRCSGMCDELVSIVRFEDIVGIISPPAPTMNDAGVSMQR